MDVNGSAKEGEQAVQELAARLLVAAFGDDGCRAGFEAGMCERVFRLAETFFVTCYQRTERLEGVEGKPLLKKPRLVVRK